MLYIRMEQMEEKTKQLRSRFGEILVKQEVINPDQLKTAIERHYGDRKNERAKIHIEETGGSIDEIMGAIEYFIAELGKTEEMEVDDLARASEEAPVIRLVNHILVNAIRHGASDIHIEPYEKDYRVRYRIDGILYDTMRPPFKIKNAIS